MDDTNCAGTYLIFPDASNAIIYNGQNVFYNAEKDHIAFYDGAKFVVTKASRSGVSNVDSYSSQEGTTPFDLSIWLPRYKMEVVLG